MINAELMTHNLCTEGYHVIDNFLELEQCDALREEAKAIHAQGLFRSAKIGVNVTSQYNNTIRTDQIAWLDEQESSPAIHAFLSKIHTMTQVLNQSLFLSLSEFETHFAIYQPGTYYKKHVDQFASQKTRKISCVYYLNKDWLATHGGALNLYNQNEKLIQQIVPQENRFICFNSELPHEVCMTYQPRYSIAGWLKTRTNPSF